MDAPKKVGRYEILEELGRGAMGTVYRAKDPSMERVVALKTIIALALASQQGSEFRERFYREARAAGGLAHPGIVPVFDVGEDEGLPFLVMEFISGQTLESALKKGERLSLDRVCELGQQMAEALAYAHRHGVVHRDIKPANILLTSREIYGIERPKITDFGVAKLAAGQITMSGQMLGTPAFMPPEQFTGAPIDGRADLFSLGVILYWMATGEQPFPGETMTSVSYKVVHTDPIPPHKLNPSIPLRLDSIILKCLAKSPADRYQTGEDLARELSESRAAGRATVMQSAIPQAPPGGLDATLDFRRPATIAASTATSTIAAPQQTLATAPANEAKMDSRLVLAAAIVLAVIAGGWYVIHTRDKTAATVNETPPPAVTASSQPTMATPSANTSVSAPPATAVAPKLPVPAKSAVSAPKIAANDDKNANGAIPASLSSTAAVAVDFDPKSLNPKENSKLKIDAERMPADLDFTVEMNGKTYFRRSDAGNKPDYDDWLVPPGVHEFRVLAKSGKVQKVSNIVSAEFSAKKKKSLKIELRLDGKPAESGMPRLFTPIRRSL